MTGRKFKKIVVIWRTLFATMMSGATAPLFTVKIRCPDCGSWMVGLNGSKKSGKRRVEGFICKDPECLKVRYKKGLKKARQFIITSSWEVQELIRDKLKALYDDLLKDGAKNKTIAKKYGISPSQISALKTEAERAIERVRNLDSLVEVPQPDRAIAIDETFLKIEGKKVYIIIATGYASRKVLGIKVSFSRKEEDMRDVFDEAERNTKEPIVTVISDAWGSTIAMVKNVGREINHVIHKHKKPYNKAVIKRYEYTEAERITTDIGVKTDVTKRRATREGHYMIKKEPLRSLPPKKVGRPKGSKDKTKRKRKHPKTKKKRGRKGLFKVFDNGKKFYCKIDPYRKTVRVSKNLPASVSAALTELLDLFALKSIQNNVSENLNSVLQSLLRLRGPKTVESVERRIRAWAMVRNDTTVLDEIQIERNVQGSFLINNLKLADVSNLEEGVLFM
jgi:transposase-like protein